jgi:hypothetical protein
MFVLVMTAACRDKKPAILFDEADGIANLHLALVAKVGETRKPRW